MKTTPELADIFRTYGADYKEQHKGNIPSQHRKAMDAIMACRTPLLGGQLFACDACGHQHCVCFSYRNRHCPKCQALPTYQWVEKRKQDLLPIPYFHIVFTLPEQLRSLALNNQVCIYNILFKAASDTLKELGEDPKRLKAKLGILAVLHTWAQTLAYHPHLHCIVTGGGISLKDQKWVASKPDFLFPVRVMSKLFRGKFLDALKQANQGGQLKHPNPVARADFKALLDTLYHTNWVVYCKPPFGGPKHVIAYLSRYTHRVAISNQRILKIEQDEVVFSYRDRKDGDQLKTMTLPALTFIQRFLLHVLPKHFVKIRYFGILCNRYRKRHLTRCRKLLCIQPVQHTQQNEDTSYLSLVKLLTRCDPTICPQCKKGHLHFAGILSKSPDRAPPAQMA